MSRTVETTKRSSRHKLTEHSDGSSEEYRKTTYQHDKKTESSNGHPHRRSGLPLPGSGRSPALSGHSAPHRLGIKAPPPKHPSDRYYAAALRAPSAVSYGRGQRRAPILPNNLYNMPALRAPSIVSYSGGRGSAPLPNNNYYNATAVRNPSELSYSGGPMRRPNPTPFGPVGHVYPSPARATPRNFQFQGGGGGFRRGLTSVVPSDSASNVPLRGNGHAYNYGGGSVSSLSGRRLPAHLTQPYRNSFRDM